MLRLPVISLFFLGLASTAWAYIPPSAYLLKSMVQKRASLKSMRIHSVVASESEAGRDQRFKVTTTYDASSRVLKCRALDESNRELYSVERRLAQADREPKIGLAVDQALFGSHSDGVAKALVDLGVPVRTERDLLALPDEDARKAAEVLSLARGKGTIAWVVGDYRLNQPSPQFWVEKDVFLPLRLVAESAGAWNEVRMEGTKTYHEIPYPSLIRLVRLKGGVEAGLLHEDVSDVTVNAGETGADFKATVAGGFTPVGEAAPEALKELLRQYFTFVR